MEPQWQKKRLGCTSRGQVKPATVSVASIRRRTSGGERWPFWRQFVLPPIQEPGRSASGSWRCDQTYAHRDHCVCRRILMEPASMPHTNPMTSCRAPIHLRYVQLSGTSRACSRCHSENALCVACQRHTCSATTLVIHSKAHTTLRTTGAYIAGASTAGHDCYDRYTRLCLLYRLQSEAALSAFYQSPTHGAASLPIQDCHRHPPWQRMHMIDIPIYRWTPSPTHTIQASSHQGYTDLRSISSTSRATVCTIDGSSHSMSGLQDAAVYRFHAVLQGVQFTSDTASCRKWERALILARRNPIPPGGRTRQTHLGLARGVPACFFAREGNSTDRTVSTHTA